MADLRQFRFFLTLSETKNFARAAEAEYITQSAMSQQIARLERELGLKLFRRGARGTELTSAGERLLPRAQAVMTAVSQFEQQAGALAEGTSGRLRIGSPTYAVRSRSRQRIVAGFSERYRGVEVSFHNAWSPQLLDDLVAGSLDLSFAMLAPQELPLDYLCVQDEPAVLLLPSVHPLAELPSVRVQDLVGHDVLLYPASINAWLHARMADPLRRAGAGVRSLTEGSLPAVIDQVRAEGAVCPAVPWEMDFVNVESLDGLVVRPTSGERGLRYQMWLARRSGPSEPAVGAFWSTAEGVLGQDGPGRASY